MRKKCKTYIVLVMFFFVNVGQIKAEENILIKSIARDNNLFTLDLYNQLKMTDGNLFFSPFSIFTALAMTWAGARENTAVQMAETLHFTEKPAQFHLAIGDLISQLNAVQKETNVELSIANAIWAQKGYQFLDEFFRIVQQSYQADFKQVDFSRAAESARQAINAWVEQQTNERIKDLLPPKVLNALTRLVLVNAIYFKGFWDNQFKSRDTREMEFWLLTEVAVKVPMMHQEHQFGYWENDWLQIIEMPYKEESLSLIVLLPKEKTGITDLEQKLNFENMMAWQSRLRKRKVIVFFPKFKIESQFSLGQTLSLMGMPDAFDPELADFSAMVGQKELYISAVIHKAFLEVNEEGSEAAAATGVVVSVTSIAPSPPIFKADHPFVFFIRDNKSQSILFLGRMLNPA